MGTVVPSTSPSLSLSHPVARAQWYHHRHPWQHFFQTPMVLQTITTYKENWSVRPDHSPPLPLWSKCSIGSSCRASCASQEHPMDIYEVCMLSIRTTHEPQPRLTPPPDTHVHTCIDAVAPSCPHPSHGCPAQPHRHSRACPPSRSLSRPPWRIARPSPSHLPSPRPLPHTSNSDVATTTV